MFMKDNKLSLRKKLLVLWRNSIICLRLDLALKLFPSNRAYAVGNRKALIMDMANFEFTFTCKNKNRPDAYSFEEALKFLEVFIDRPLLPEEWNQIMEWKGIKYND